MTDQSPVNPVPKLILGPFILMAAVELACSLGGAGIVGGAGAVGWRVRAIEQFAFAPAIQEALLSGRGGWDLAIRYLTYPLVHGSFTHAAFAMALWLALGKFVADLYRWWAVIVIVLAGTIGGAAILGLWGAAMGTNPPLFGAYPAVYALIGAYTYVSWLQLGQAGESQLRAFSLIGILLGLQVVFGMLFGGDPTWPAELGAFALGGVAAVLVAPGGWAAFLKRLRRR